MPSTTPTQIMSAATQILKLSKLLRNHLRLYAPQRNEGFHANATTIHSFTIFMAYVGTLRACVRLFMQKTQAAAVFALALFALMGGCLVIALDGFTTSSKNANWSVFVPAPQAYAMAAIMFTLSVIGIVWLLQQSKASRSVFLIAAASYGCAAFAVTKALTIHFR